MFLSSDIFSFGLILLFLILNFYKSKLFNVNEIDKGEEII